MTMQRETRLLIAVLLLAPALRGGNAHAAPAAPTGFAYTGAFAVREGPRGRFIYMDGLAVGAGGSVYVTDGGRGHVWVFGPGGRPQAEIGGRGPGFSDALHNPGGVAVDAQGDVYVGDANGHRVAVFGPDGKPQPDIGGPDSAHPLTLPSGVALDAQGSLYVADMYTGTVSVFAPGGRFRAEFGPRGLGHGSRKFDILGFADGVAVDARGRVYATDSRHGHVYVFAPAGPARYALRATLITGEGALFIPRSAALDAAGDVYVADSGHHRVRVFGPGGQPLAEIGGPDAGRGRLKDPIAVALDAAGDVYVADSGHDRVVVFRPLHAPPERPGRLRPKPAARR